MHSWVASQIPQVAAIDGHSIRLHTEATSTTLDLNWSNCFMYALGISIDDVETVKNKAHVRTRTDIQFDWEFVAELVAAAVLYKRHGEGVRGDVVVYFDGDRPRHAGLWTGSRVISKWGYGVTHVWDHCLYEAPSTYGDDACMFLPPSKPDVLGAFETWARKRTP